MLYQAIVRIYFLWEVLGLQPTLDCNLTTSLIRKLLSLYVSYDIFLIKTKTQKGAGKPAWISCCADYHPFWLQNLFFIFFCRCFLNYMGIAILTFSHLGRYAVIITSLLFLVLSINLLHYIYIYISLFEKYRRMAIIQQDATIFNAMVSY